MKQRQHHIVSLLFVALCIGAPASSQNTAPVQSSQLQATQTVPAAPLPQSPPNPEPAQTGITPTPANPGGSISAGPPINSPTLPAPPNPTGITGPVTTLSLQQAEAIAIKNNPQISVARLTALASQQVTREYRSNLWPTVTGALTAVDAQAGSRITAGALNNPIIYERAAAGVTVSQLITDFGRTSNLISSANYSAKAENQNALATKEQILLAVNQAFFNALQAQAVLTVAQQTVNARQTVSNQVGALFKSKLKSELDFSFANVNLAQAQLLLLDAENNQNATQATLSMVLGYPAQQNFQLIDDLSPVSPPPGNLDDLISKAFSMRPEILSLQFQYQSAKKFQTAERDLFFPNLRALGAFGVTPAGNVAVAPEGGAFNNSYAAAGANLEIPLFNGFLFAARTKEASLRAQATDERLRDMKNLISRDVRTSWLNANTAYSRLSVTRQLLDQAKLGLDLAQARYKLGLGSIVELSQAQLQETQAEITNAEATYDYRLSLAVLTYQTTGI